MQNYLSNNLRQTNMKAETMDFKITEKILNNLKTPSFILIACSFHNYLGAKSGKKVRLLKPTFIGFFTTKLLFPMS